MESLIKQLKNSWFVIVFIGSMIVGWTTFSSRLANAEADIKDLQVLSQQLQQQALDIAVIKTDVGYIKAKVR